MQFFTFIILVLISSMNAFAVEKNVKLIVLVDRSTSMSSQRTAVSHLVERVTQKLKQSCDHYSIAVGELQYQDRPVSPVSLLGNQINPKDSKNPFFVTETTENGVEIIASRIRDASFNGSCESDCKEARRAVGAEEVTYSSVVSVIEKNKNLITETPLDFLATLMITNTAPIFESLKPREALDRIAQVQPLDLYMSTDISYTQWDKESEKCRLDMPRDFSISDFSKSTLNSLTLFSELSGGQSFNICRPLDYDIQLEEFINLILVRAGCYPMS